jgi:hypothetical protein
MSLMGDLFCFSYCWPVFAKVPAAAGVITIEHYWQTLSAETSRAAKECL